MLALRLARGAPPLALFRRLLLAAAAAGVTFLMLGAVGHAAANPGSAGDGATRMLWCLVPLAAAMQLAVAVARTETSRRALTGLDAAGVGPYRMPLLAAVSTTASCLLGSVVALVLFLLLRGHLSGLPFAGAASDVLGGAGPALPLGAVLLLFLLVPMTAAATCLVALRPRPLPPGGREGNRTEPATLADAPPSVLPPGLPWGVALTATGLALETFTSRGAAGDATGSLLPLPETPAGSPPGVLMGWVLTAIGLVLAGPGLTHLCGRVVALGRPGALRLLAGRVLQEDAERVGRPLGVLCAVGSGALAAGELYGPARGGQAAAEAVFGPLTVLGAVLVLGCATVSALAAAAESRALRAPATASLLQLGAPRALLRNAAALRAVAVVAVLGLVAWAVGHLAALPLTA